ncbi:MAG: hypothetical protein ACYTEO_14145 [Planctomycetota bacterium]|jgi:hypothetical protein
MGFMQAPPYIYEKMNTGGLIDRWCQEDYVSIFSNLHAEGFQWDPVDLVLRQMGAHRIAQSNTPWCHAKSTPGKHCALDHNITFKHWKIIHPRCMECWKLCVTLPTNGGFEQLLDLEQLQLRMGYSSKCGIEMRDYTPKHYGGYWYTESFDEGRDRFKEVKEALKKHVSEEAAENLILKRACTEYEMVKGPSPYWHNTRAEEKMLSRIEALVDFHRSNNEQSDLIKNNVRLKWVLWAHANNDMSYIKYNGGKKLFPGYVSYHEGPREDLKRDIGVALAQAKSGIEPVVSDEFLKQTDELANKHDLESIDGLTAALGAFQSNPLQMIRSVRMDDIPEEMKGDHDELT